MELEGTNRDRKGATTVTTTATTESTDERPPLPASASIGTGYGHDQSREPADHSLLPLRSFVILIVAFAMAVASGTVAGLSAAYAAPHHPAAIGILAGLAIFGSTMLAAATAMNALVSREAR